MLKMLDIKLYEDDMAMMHKLAKEYGFSDNFKDGEIDIHKHKNGSELKIHPEGHWQVTGPGKYNVTGKHRDHDRLEKALGVAGD